MKDGRVLVAPEAMPALIAWNSGLFGGPLPPTDGCAWHPEQLLRLNRGPRPLFAPPETTSCSWNRPRPLSKNSMIPVGLFAPTEARGSGLVWLAPGWPLIAPGRTPGSVCDIAAPGKKNTAENTRTDANCVGCFIPISCAWRALY